MEGGARNGLGAHGLCSESRAPSCRSSGPRAHRPLAGNLQFTHFLDSFILPLFPKDAPSPRPGFSPGVFLAKPVAGAWEVLGMPYWPGPPLFPYQIPQMKHRARERVKPA